MKDDTFETDIYTTLEMLDGQINLVIQLSISGGETQFYYIPINALTRYAFERSCPSRRERELKESILREALEKVHTAYNEGRN